MKITRVAPAEFKVPEVKPMKKKLKSNELKSIVATLPNDLNIYINGKLVSEIKGLQIEYDNWKVNINLKFEE